MIDRKILIYYKSKFFDPEVRMPDGDSCDLIPVACTDYRAECCPPLAQPTLTTGQAGRIADVFKALSHPHRVLLVNMLVGSRFPVCVCDLTAAIGLAQSTVSHHLKLLLQAGVVTREQRGIWAYYSVDRAVMRWLGSVVALDPVVEAGPPTQAAVAAGNPGNPPSSWRKGVLT